MAAKHDLSTKSASPNDTATEIVNVKKGNIDDITMKTTSLLEIGDKIHLLTLLQQILPQALSLHHKPPHVTI